jgi:hypothetical protein
MTTFSLNIQHPTSNAMEGDSNETITQSDAEKIRLKRLAKLQSSQADSNLSPKPNEEKVCLVLFASFLGLSKYGRV